MDTIDWKTIALKMLDNSNPLFDHLKARIKEHEKTYTSWKGFAYVDFDESISCGDVYTEWYDEFFGVGPKQTLLLEYDFYAEATGRLIIHPVKDIYKSELKTNIYAKDILKIWDMGEEIDEEELLNEDHRQNFKNEIKVMIDEFERRDNAFISM